MTGRVLVVQGEAQLRDVLGRTLERAGHTVFLAQTGEGAASTLAKQQVDAVVLDLVLPNMMGQTLFHVIVSKWPELRHRIVIVADAVQQAKHQDWLDLYQLPVLRKPLVRADARGIVKTVLGVDPLEANGA